jgi:hypothetical protein
MDQELEQDRNREASGQGADTRDRWNSNPSLTHARAGARGRISPPFLTHARPHPIPPHPCQPGVSPLQSTLGTMSDTSRTVVKKIRDAALEHVRKVLRNGGSLLTRPEASFVRTSCHIVGLDGETTIKAIVKRTKDKGGRQPRKVLDQLRSQLMELAERVDKHKRPTPNPAASTRAVDAMGAPVRSLAHLQGCADALREATEGQYSKGIKAAKKAMENANSDFKATIDRLAGASRWKKETLRTGSPEVSWSVRSWWRRQRKC